MAAPAALLSLTVRSYSTAQRSSLLTDLDQ
jgi:hypothetical protein